MRRLVRIAAVVVACGVTDVRSAAAQQDAGSVGSRLLADPAVKRALDLARDGEPDVIANQIRFCEIPAPTFHEERRAVVLKGLFEELGLQKVRIDDIGNVIGERPGRAARPHVLFASHLDTVFPEGTPLTVTREGATLKGPGIGDNCRGLAALVGVVRALRDAKLETPGPITFVANVREEGIGNGGGVRHLLEGEFRGQIDRFVSMDGSGTGFTYLGVGTRRYRVTFKGPGGHSYYAFGIANPMHAMGRAVARVAELQVPKDPRTTFSVGLAGGGTSINSIAAEAWMEIDMRSHDLAALEALVARFERVVADAVAEENARWEGKGAITAEFTSLGAMPPGVMADDSPIVRATTSVTAAVGLKPFVFPSTTDSNIPMSMGIPALTIDGGGDGGGGHSLKEVFDSTDSYKGTQRALLLVVALAQP